MSTGALEDVTSSELDSGYVRERVEDWIRRVEALLASVESWVPPTWDVKRIGPVVMNEEIMRHYGVAPRELPALEVTKEDGTRMTVVPRGLWIVGGNGRVDLNVADEHFAIVDTAETFQVPEWTIAPVASRRVLEPFTSATFLKAA